VKQRSVRKLLGTALRRNHSLSEGVGSFPVVKRLATVAVDNARPLE
jgi:hypothetical protein